MIAKLTIAEKDSVLGIKYDGIQYFNPVQDADENWVISEEEINNCTNVDYQWVKSLTLSVFNPPIIIDPLV
jgi:hypothetical protein